jgi:hypothetical protein
VHSADAVIVVVGLDGGQEAEGKDRQSLALPGSQSKLVEDAAAAASANNVPVIVIVMSGSAVDLSQIKANPAVNSIFWVGYPGQSGGTAVADAVLGISNQWGKLPMTWYDNGFCGVAPLDNYAMRPDPATAYPGRTHRFYTGAWCSSVLLLRWNFVELEECHFQDSRVLLGRCLSGARLLIGGTVHYVAPLKVPVYKFGDGLSYTSFSHGMPVRVLGPSAGAATASTPVLVDEAQQQRVDAIVATFTVTVTNVGGMAGDEVVLLFVEPPAAAVLLGAPKQQLAAFERVTIDVGMSETVKFELHARHLLVPPAAVSAAGGAAWRVRTNSSSDGENMGASLWVQYAL